MSTLDPRQCANCGLWGGNTSPDRGRGVLIAPCQLTLSSRGRAGAWPDLDGGSFRAPGDPGGMVAPHRSHAPATPAAPPRPGSAAAATWVAAL